MLKSLPSFACKPAVLIAMGILIVLGWVLISSQTIKRPYQFDEVNTVNAYTSFGYFLTRGDLEMRSRFSVFQTAKGLAQTITNWKAWNDHIVASWAISVSSFFFGFDEKASRLPSVAACLGATAILMAWCYRNTKSLLLTALVGVGFVFCPYIYFYSQTARGYLMAILLMLINVILVERLWSKMMTLSVIGGLSLLAFLQALNLLNTVLMWLIPLAAVAGTGAAWKIGREGGIFRFGTIFRSAWIRGWLFQWGIAGTLVAIFAIDHWWGIKDNMGKFGVTANSPDDLFHQGYWLLSQILPGYWPLVGLLGVAGWFAMSLGKERHWLGATALLSTVLVLLFAAISHKYPYPRNCTLYLPLLFMGVIWMWKCTQSMQSRGIALAGRMAIAALLLCNILNSLIDPKPSPLFESEETLGTSCTAAARKLSESGKGERDVFILSPYYNNEDQCYRLYLPESNRYFTPSNKNSEVDVVIPLDHLYGKLSLNCKSPDGSSVCIAYKFPQPLDSSIINKHGTGAVAIIPMRWSATPPTDLGASALDIVAWEGPGKGYFQVERFIADRFAARKDLSKSGFLLKTIGDRQCAFFPISSKIELDFARTLIADLEAHVHGETYFFVQGSPLMN